MREVGAVIVVVMVEGAASEAEEEEDLGVVASEDEGAGKLCIRRKLVEQHLAMALGFGH